MAKTQDPAMVIRVAANLDQLRAGLKQGEIAIEQTTAGMAKMVASFSGDKLIQQAQNLSGALREMGQGAGVMGGALKLTAEEASAKLSVMERAMEKLRLTNRQIPPEMQQTAAALKAVADKAKEADPPVGKLSTLFQGAWGSVKSFAGALGLGMGAAALGGFVKRVVDTAGSINDLSHQLGTSAEFTQRMKYVAEQTGTTIEAFGTAITRMNKNLSIGDDSTVSALKKAGLSLSELRQMKPEDAFYKIADAVKGIQNPMLQTEIVTKALGKTAAELLPAMQEDVRKLGGEVSVMSDDTVARLDAAGDAWARLGNKIVTITGEALVSILDFGATVRGVFGTSERFFDFLAMSFQYGMTNALATSTATQQVMEAMAASLSKQEKQQVDDLAKKGMKAKEIAALYREEVRPAIEAYVKTLEQAARIKFTSTDDELAKGAKEQVEAAKAELERWKEAIDRHNEEQKAGEEATVDAIEKLVQELTDEAKFQLDEWRDAIRRHQEEWKAGEQATIDELERIDEGRLNQAKADLDEWGQIIAKHAKDQKDAEDAVIKALEEKDKAFGKLLNTLVADLNMLANVAGDTFGGVIRDVSKTLAAINAVTKATKAWKEMSDAAKASAIGTAAPLLAVSAIVSGFIGLIRESNAQQKASREAWARFQREAAERERETMEKALALVDELKIKWSELTAAARDARIDASVLAIVQKLELLKLAGVNSAAAIRSQADAINELLDNIAESGGIITPALMPIVEQMTELGLVSEATMRKLMGLTQNPAPVDWKAMKQAADEYGISLNDLGPKFQQARLDETFNKLAADFALLRDGGANMTAVLEKMAPKANEAIKDAIKYGTQIPATMKPMLESLAKAGLLVDENGNKLTDLGKLNFATPIEESMKELVKLFKDFLEQIKQSKTYLEKLPREVNVDVNYKENRGGNTGGYGGDETNSASAATGGRIERSGISYMARGGSITSARILKFTPRGEDVVPIMGAVGEGVVSRKGMSVIGPTGLQKINNGEAPESGGTMTVQLVLPDGRTLADVVVPWIPGAVKRYGLR